jgi:electron transfer flavoprotein alpha subunit
MSKNDIWVIGDKIIPYNLALISKARAMADICGGSVTALSLYEDNPQDCIRAGADGVYLLRGLQEVSDDSAIAEALAGIISKDKPGTVLFQATIRGRAIAPAIAAILGTGLTADCIDLDMDQAGCLLQKRPALGDSIIAEIICEKHRPQMATVRPGILPEPVWRENSTGQIDKIPVRILPKTVRTGFLKSRNDYALSQAGIILAGGAGIGSREGFDYLHHIASCIGGCVGASRAAVDAGYAPYHWQIGQTGVAVRPRLYIAVGISGSVQHLVGMNTSDYIIAVNHDRNAPIFSYADYGIVGDWKETMDQFLLSWKENNHEL